MCNELTRWLFHYSSLLPEGSQYFITDNEGLVFEVISAWGTSYKTFFQSTPVPLPPMSDREAEYVARNTVMGCLEWLAEVSQIKGN
jgi:hypothetical protein